MQDDTAVEAPEVSFHEAFACAMEAADITQLELARRVGCSGSSISQWLKGDVPVLAHVVMIEDALGLELGALVRRHSPDAWAIIQRIGKPEYSWAARTWRQKMEEALIGAPMASADRRLFMDLVDRFAAWSAPLEGQV